MFTSSVCFIFSVSHSFILLPFSLLLTLICVHVTAKLETRWNPLINKMWGFYNFIYNMLERWSILGSSSQYLCSLPKYSLCVWGNTELLLYLMDYLIVLFSLSACSEESPVWMSQIWADESHLLRLCPLTTSFILTVKNRINFDPQRSIQLYREKHRYLESHMQVSVHFTDDSHTPPCAQSHSCTSSLGCLLWSN